MAKTAKQREVLCELEKTHGEVTTALKATRTARVTFERWMAFDKDFRACVNAMEAELLDFAEAALYKLISEGDRQAIIFFLRTRGRARGYVLKDEIEVTQTHHLKADIKFDFSQLASDELRNFRELARRSRTIGPSDSGGISQEGR